MKWCNICEIECGDEMTSCPKCQSSLTDVDPSIKANDQMVKGDFEYLTHIKDNVEADVFAAFLKGNGIRTYVHYQGNGPYKGMLLEVGSEDTTIFVDSMQLEEAQVLMASFEYVLMFFPTKTKRV